MPPPNPVAGAAPLVDNTSAREELHRVLVVEDDGELGMLFRDWIREFYGEETAVHVTATAADTETTLDSVPDLDAALIDRNLPDSDGEDLAATVRSRFDALAVIVTGTTPDSGLIELPVDDYLLKPVEGETLLKRLSLLEKLDAAGTLRDYSDARKASLLEYHLPEPEQDPLFRRFANRWSYDRLEIARVAGEPLVYELYTGAGSDGDSRDVSVSIVGPLEPDLQTLLANDEAAPVGELATTADGYAWIDADRRTPIDPGPDSIAVYEFTCEAPERHIADDSTEIPHRELEETLEAEFN